MTVLALGILIASYGQPTSDRCPQGRTCLTPPEMDYFLQRDARCGKLINDSTELAGKIEKYKINEALYKANEQDLKSQVTAQKSIVFNYKAELTNCQVKYIEAQGKAKLRGKMLIGSLIINVGFIALGVVLLKL
jgi:hypothetical protein